MDQSLDEVIAARRRTRHRVNTKQQLLGQPPRLSLTTTGKRTVTTAKAATSSATPSTTPADKIIVSNLPPDVSEVQIKELFHSTIGPLREVTLHHDSAGRSKGIAAVHFQKKGDGSKAYQQYNNRLIDGKRPMKIEIVVDPARPQSLASRVAPLGPAVATVPVSKRPRGKIINRKKSNRPPKSVADLDAEMEDYTAANAAPAA